MEEVFCIADDFEAVLKQHPRGTKIVGLSHDDFINFTVQCAFCDHEAARAIRETAVRIREGEATGETKEGDGVPNS